MELQYTPIRAQWPTKDSVITTFRYILACPLVENKKILELGCGSCDGVEILSEYAKEYVGVDTDPNWKENNSKPNGKTAFVQADACDLPSELNGKFDVVIAFELIEHLKDPVALCSQIRKALTPNGLALISTPNFDLLSRGSENTDRPLYKHHIREYRTADFEKYLKNFEMEFCIYGLSQLAKNPGPSNNFQIVLGDTLFELKAGKQFPDMQIVNKQLLPENIPLHYSQSFFAIVGNGSDKKQSFIDTISKKLSDIIASKAGKSILMEDICAMSVEWILHRRNEHLSETEVHTKNLEDIVKDREEQIEQGLQVIRGLDLRLKTLQDTISVIKNSFSYKTGHYITLPLRFLYRKAKTLLTESKVAVKYDLKKKLNNSFKSHSRKTSSDELFTIPKKPKVVHLAISRTCNISCIMCPIDRDALKGKKKFLDFDIFKKVFGNGKDFEFLNFVGAGEVFVAKDFINILNYCFDRGFSALGCFTNLQLISKELAELMVKNRFHQITASIDGCTRETFEYIRRGAKFETFLKTMDIFGELKKRYNSDTPNFTFSTVAMNSNIHEFPGIVKLAHKYGVESIYVARLHVSKEEILDESLFFHQEKYNRYYDETVDLCKKLGIKIELPPKFGLPPVKKGKKVRDCKMPFESIYVDVDGVVCPCVCRVDPEVSVGNIYEDDLLDIWRSEKFHSFRKSMFSDSPPKQCRECTFSVLDPNKPESHMSPELAKKVKGKNS